MKIISNNRPIAFFDSGVGGLTVYTKLKALLPNENYIYFGDTKHMPYGEKSEAELLQYADEIFRFFIEQNAKAVVMACNTTSSVIYDKIKDKYDVKIYPVIQSCAKVLAQLPISRLGIFATNATVKSGAYKREIAKYNNDIEIAQIACPSWVKIVENDAINDEQSLLEIQNKMDEMLKHKPDKIVLGCTHYPYLLDILSKYAPKDTFIDPAQDFAQFIKTDLENNNLTEKAQGTEAFYVSANPEEFKQASKLFYDLRDLPNLALNED